MSTIKRPPQWLLGALGLALAVVVWVHSVLDRVFPRNP